ncbi:MAG TPA: acyl-CoA dehydrogenase family protein [Thermoanaerobaculia bacterium]|nr:acyl-CoA dehydrogenase family protein [Thermoanaerobaculia bacterium]
MDFDLSKPQKMLKQSAREFLARECKPERVRAAIATDTADDRELFAAAAEQGWTALIIPETYGGLGLGSVDLAVVAEEMGRACMPGPLFATIFASAAIMSAGTEEQKRRWLEPIAAGEMRATVALGNEFVLDAGVADLILRFTSDGIEEIENANPQRTPSMDETRKLYSWSVSAMPPLSVTRQRPKAAAWPPHSKDIAIVALCAEMVGGMQWVLDTTVEYAKTRQQFGRVIGSFQAVQHMCADMLLLTESARSATYNAAWSLKPLDVSIAKAYCSDAYREVCNRGIQVHGGIGFTWEHDLQLYFKRAKASETLFGDATFHRERIAALVVDRKDSVAETSAEVVDHGLSVT